MSSVASQIAQGGSAAKSSGSPGSNWRGGFLDGDCPDFRPTGHRPKVGLGLSPWRWWTLLHWVPFRSGYDLARVSIAATLMVAALLKAWQLATEPVLGHSILDNRWLLIAVVEGELGLACCLLAGVAPKLTWLAALGCFSMFTLVSLSKGLAGEASCHCFGRLPTNPFLTATLDLSFVVALLIWRPRLLPSPSGRGTEGEGGRGLFHSHIFTVCPFHRRGTWGTVPIFVRRKWDCPLALSASHRRIGRLARRRPSRRVCDGQLSRYDAFRCWHDHRRRQNRGAGAARGGSANGLRCYRLSRICQTGRSPTSGRCASD